MLRGVLSSEAHWGKQMKLHTACIVLLLVVLVWGYIQSHKTNAGRLSFLRVQTAFSTLKTGDMIFTKSKNWTSRVQQYFFGSFINHCAMIYKASDGGLWIWDLAPQVGAYMTPLDEFIRNNWAGRPPNPQNSPLGVPVSYVVPRITDRFEDSVQQKSSLFVRRLHKPLDQTKTLEFIQRNLGRPYSWRFWLGAYTRVTGLEFPLGWSLATDPQGMFCSELVAHTYAHAGALHPLLSAPSSILPAHFWENDLQWIGGYGMHAPEQLIGTIPEIQQSEHVEPWEKGVTTSPHIIDALVTMAFKEEMEQDTTRT